MRGSESRLLEDEKKPLQKLIEMSVKAMGWGGGKKYSILKETNQEQVGTISSLTIAKADLGDELKSGLGTMESWNSED